MRVLRLIFKEIGFRKLSFGMALVAIGLPVGVFVGSAGLFGSYEKGHDELMSASSQAQLERWEEYQDSMRVMMKRLGFNLMILPEARTPSDPEGEKMVMPEEFATRLAEKDLRLVNHVLPFLERRFHWKEKDRWVRMFGTQGEVYIKASWQKPIQEEVAQGTMALGYNVHQELGLKKGDKVMFDGRELVVGECYLPRTVDDDERVWMHISTVQEILGEPGKISGMLALSCDCADKDVPLIDKAIRGVVPGVKVMAQAAAMATRNEVRSSAREKGDEEFEEQAKDHHAMQEQRGEFAGLLLPMVLVGSFLSVALLSWLNVRERRQEIGIFRAIGYSRASILGIFLGKALFVGALGAVVGLAGAAIVMMVRGGSAEWAHLPGVAGIAVIGAPVLALVAALLPAAVAAGQDPVDALRDD
jgi:putative ABC transport system permease protein